MRSRAGTLAAVLLALTALLALGPVGCGKFGDRQDPDLTATYAPVSVGCMNTIGARVEQYVAGTVSSDDWHQTVDCAAGAIAQFRQFVEPSSPAGYTRQDLASFLANFLLTKFPDNSDIVDALFKIKALLIGGTTDVVAFTELDQVNTLIGVVRTQSLYLLPYVSARAVSGSPATLLQLADALSTTASSIATALAATPGSRDLSWADATAVLTAIGRVAGWAIPPTLIPIATVAKPMLFAGWAGGIEAPLIPVIAQTAISGGGLALAFGSGPSSSAGLTGMNPVGDFYFQLATRARPILDAALTRNGGSIRLTAVNALLEQLPSSGLPAPLSVIESTLVPLVNTMLRSTTPNGIDESVVGLLYSIAGQWDSSEIHLETLFSQLGASQSDQSVLPSNFTEAADLYAQGLDTADQALVSRLETLATSVAPLFKGDDNQMTFDRQDVVSLGQLQKLLLIRLGAEQLLASYSSAVAKDSFSEPDLQHLLNDYQDIALATHFLDATIPNTASRRFLEADLFTMVSNGNNLIDINEGTYFLADFLSGQNFAARVRAFIAPTCGSTTQLDSLGWEWMDPTCFRTLFYGSYLDLWDHFPHLTDFYGSLTSAQQLTFQQVLEKGARYYGYTQRPFASYDTGGMIGLMQYMETVFMRFDQAQNQVLDLSDAMLAYPVFKDTLAKIANQNPSDDSRIEAILTYTLHNAKVPTTDFVGIVEFLLWEAEKPLWKISANRMTVYSVMAGLTAPVIPPPVPNPALSQYYP